MTGDWSPRTAPDRHGTQRIGYYLDAGSKRGEILRAPPTIVFVNTARPGRAWLEIMRANDESQPFAQNAVESRPSWLSRRETEALTEGDGDVSNSHRCLLNHSRRCARRCASKSPRFINRQAQNVTFELPWYYRGYYHQTGLIVDCELLSHVLEIKFVTQRSDTRDKTFWNKIVYTAVNIIPQGTLIHQQKPWTC